MKLHAENAKSNWYKIKILTSVALSSQKTDKQKQTNRFQTVENGSAKQVSIKRVHQ